MSAAGRRRNRRPGERRGAVAAPSARRSATRSRSTRRAASSSSPTERCTASTRPRRRAAVTWRAPYANTGTKKPGQTEAGSGTTPTLMGSRVRGDHRQRRPDGRRRAAARKDGHRDAARLHASGLRPGARVDRPVADRHRPLDGRREQLRIQRPDRDRARARPPPRASSASTSTTAGTGCRTVWHSDERAPSVVPKLSLANGLVYTYTKPPNADGTDAWYFTAIDFRTGKHRLQPPGRHGARLQQQLRAGQHRPRRLGLRRRARWLGPHLGRLTPARRSSSTSTSGLGRGRRRAHVARAYS